MPVRSSPLGVDERPRRVVPNAQSKVLMRLAYRFGNTIVSLLPRRKSEQFAQAGRAIRVTIAGAGMRRDKGMVGLACLAVLVRSGSFSSSSSRSAAAADPLPARAGRGRSLRRRLASPSPAPTASWHRGALLDAAPGSALPSDATCRRARARRRRNKHMKAAANATRRCAGHPRRRSSAATTRDGTDHRAAHRRA